MKLEQYISETGEYIIPVSWETCSLIKIKASNLKAAIEKAEAMTEEIPLPSSCYQDYVDGSFKIDMPDNSYAILAQEFTGGTDVVI